MIPEVFIENWRKTIPWQMAEHTLKKTHRDFHMDMSVLLPSKLHWNFEEAYQFVVDNVISRLPSN